MVFLVKKPNLKMKKLRIGIDIDNVIADSYPAYLSRYNERFGTKIILEEVTDFYFSTRDVTQKDGQEFIYRLITDDTFQMELPPYRDVPEVISRWSKKGYRIHYITARPESTRNVTQKWLQKHGFGVLDATLDMYDENKHSDDTDYKIGVVVEKKIDLMIEDAKEIACALPIPVILLDRPWNRGTLPSHVIRVADWLQIERILEDKTLRLLTKKRNAFGKS